jgi:hypothetical protein
MVAAWRRESLDCSGKDSCSSEKSVFEVNAMFTSSNSNRSAKWFVNTFIGKRLSGTQM